MKFSVYNMFQQMLKEVDLMKLSEKEIKKKSKEAIKNCLAGVSFLQIKDIKETSADKPSAPDIIVKVSSPQGEKIILVELKTSGQPRIAREAINELIRHRDLPEFENSYAIFMAPYISQRTAEICEKEKVGYSDLVGNCRLSFDTVHVEKKGQPNIFSERRELRSLYSPKASRILRVLLLEPFKQWKIEELAKKADVSIGHVSNVKRLLTEREWVVQREDGFSLYEPTQLLKEWIESYHHSFKKNEAKDFYSFEDISSLEYSVADVFKELNVRYALTGFSGAARFSPFVRYNLVTVYVEEVTDKMIKLLNIKQVTSGPNLRLIIPNDTSVFFDSRDIEGVHVASPLQVYLDLTQISGRGEEAAQELFDTQLKPIWSAEEIIRMK